MKLINLEKAIEYAKEKDYIKTTNQERALREVLELSKVNAIPIETIDKIRAEIDGYCSDNRDRNDGLYIAMKIIDKYKVESEYKDADSN